MLKLIMTDFKKEYLYGDCHLEKDSHYFPLIGSRIKIKLLGIFWITFNQFNLVDENNLIVGVADHLTDYLNSKDYKPKQDEDMDKVIELLNIKFDHDDMNELYWYDGNCT